MNKESIKRVSKNSVKMICYLATGIALYIALSMTMKIPLIGHIQTDLGYIVFGVFCVLFGWKAFVVGLIGCFIESFIFSGWIPIGWMLGQIFIGITCGICYTLCDKKIKNKTIKYIICISVTALSITIGIIGIKTAVECLLYKIPLVVKITKNSIAAVADFIPMVLGFIVGELLKKRIKRIVDNKSQNKNSNKEQE